MNRLLEINERMRYFDPESYAQAIGAVQKILVIVADTLVPLRKKSTGIKKAVSGASDRINTSTGFFPILNRTRGMIRVYP